MKIKKLPFNIDFFTDKKSSYLGMIPISTLQIFETKQGDYHPGGLYSNIIFGRQGEETRDALTSYIDLKAPIFHPLYYNEMTSLKKLYAEILKGTGYARWDKDENDFIRADVISGETGFAFFVSHFNDIVFKRNKSKARDLKIDFLEKYRSVCFIERLIVIPAGLRDIEIMEDGQPKEDDLNPMYRRLLSVANTINVTFEDRNSEILDQPKMSLQNATQDVYDYIFNILEGKKGFLKGKLASRRITGSTRNVLSGMETGTSVLGDVKQPDINTTMVGLFQYIKAVEPYLTEYSFHNLFMEEFFTDLKEDTKLIDRKTLRSVSVELSEKTKDKWGTSDGLNSVINTFSESKLRHNPVVVDGHYLKLIYQDDKSFKVFDSIDELPSHLSSDNVHPMTWAEMFYLHVERFVNKTRGMITRYPIMETRSVYPSKLYLKTTVRGFELEELGDGWEPTGHRVLEFPDTIGKGGFFDTMSVSPFMLLGLGAD